MNMKGNLCQARVIRTVAKRCMHGWLVSVCIVVYPQQNCRTAGEDRYSRESAVFAATMMMR
jgi:hypothetical protein